MVRDSTDILPLAAVLSKSFYYSVELVSLTLSAATP